MPTLPSQHLVATNQQLESSDQLEHSIRVIRHIDSKIEAPQAKSVVFAQNRKTFEKSNLSLPPRISEPVEGSEALTLKRVVGSHCLTQWAPKRGLLIYGAGSQFCAEELDSGKQTRISLPGHLSTLGPE